jgi:hypothetical protein
VDVHHRQLQRDAGDNRLGRGLGLAAPDRRHVGARAAHVEGEHVLEAAGGCRERRADHAAGRPREHARGGLLRGGVHVLHASGGAHDEGPGDAGRLGAVGEMAQVCRDAGREIRVGRGRGEAFVLAELGQDVAGERDVDVGQGLAHRVGDGALVLGMAEGEQQAHRDRLHVGVAQARHGPLHAGRIQRLDLAVGAHPLGNREPQLPGDEGRRPVLRQVVERGAVLAGDLEHVAKALGRDERGARAAALEQRVRAHRHAVREDGDVTGFQARRLDGPHRALGLVLRRGRHLGGDELPVHERDEIGERPAHVDSQPRVCHGAIISIR